MLCHLQRVVDGRLGRVDDEVSQCEAEALRSSPQVKRLGPRPGKRLLLWAGRSRSRRLALIAPILLLGLKAEQTNTNVSFELQNIYSVKICVFVYR